jgi:hypothetical protein
MIVGYLLMFAGNFAFMFDPRFYTSPESVGPEFFLGSMAGMFAGMAVILLGLLFWVVSTLFMSPALGHLIAKGDFKAAFQIKEWWPIFKVNFSGYLLALVIRYGVYMAMIWIVYALYFSVVLCILLPFAMVAITFIMSLIHFSLLAVTYRDGMRILAE